MSGGFSASPPQSSLYSRIPRNTQFTSHCCNLLWSSSSAPLVPRASRDHPLYSSLLELKPTSYGALRLFPRKSLRCNSSSTPGGPGPGERDSKRVLDAFFLGKALAEALNERIESTVGEFLSVVGRLQAEQQKQVQDFQEELLERAKRAKEKAAREAMEAQGLIPKSSTANISTTTDSDTSKTAPAVTDASATISPSLPSSSSMSTDNDQNPTSTAPLLGVSTDD